MSDSICFLSENSRDKSTDAVCTYTLDQISQQYHVCKRTLRNYIKQGRLRATRVGRRYQVTHTALLEFLGDIPAS